MLCLLFTQKKQKCALQRRSSQFLIMILKHFSQCAYNSSLAAYIALYILDFFQNKAPTQKSNTTITVVFLYESFKFYKHIENVIERMLPGNAFHLLSAHYPLL